MQGCDKPSRRAEMRGRAERGTRRWVARRVPVVQGVREWVRAGGRWVGHGMATAGAPPASSDERAACPLPVNGFTGFPVGSPAGTGHPEGRAGAPGGPGGRV